MSDFYPDASFREMAKWAHDRNARARREQEAAQRVSLADLLYEGYYPEDSD